MAEDRACSKCQKTLEEQGLTKCQICYRLFCDECAVGTSGRKFCSISCAEFFFRADDEDL